VKGKGGGGGGSDAGRGGKGGEGERGRGGREGGGVNWGGRTAGPICAFSKVVPRSAGKSSPSSEHDIWAYLVYNQWRKQQKCRKGCIYKRRPSS